MMSLSSSIMKAMGVRRAYMDTTPVASESHLPRTNHRERYSPIPAIPADIGFHSSKTTGGANPTGVLQNVAGNPAVILGLGLTTMALLGMIRKSALGDKFGTQKMMQYRIMAQLFTVTALVTGVTFFGGIYDGKDEAELQSALHH